MRSSVLFASPLLLLAPTLLAHADTFTLTGGATTISFSLPASPTPTRVNSAFGAFTIDNVVVTTNGTPRYLNASFYDAFGYDRDGLCLSSGGAGCEEGLLEQAEQNGFVAPLFSGGLSDPTFITGNYWLQNSYNDDDTTYDQNFFLTISAPATVTPEPSSLVLLGTGLLSATGLLRRRFRR